MRGRRRAGAGAGLPPSQQPDVQAAARSGRAGPRTQGEGAEPIAGHASRPPAPTLHTLAVPACPRDASPHGTLGNGPQPAALTHPSTATATSAPAAMSLSTTSSAGSWGSGGPPGAPSARAAAVPPEANAAAPAAPTPAPLAELPLLVRRTGGGGEGELQRQAAGGLQRARRGEWSGRGQEGEQRATRPWRRAQGPPLEARAPKGPPLALAASNSNLKPLPDPSKQPPALAAVPGPRRPRPPPVNRRGSPSHPPQPRPLTRRTAAAPCCSAWQALRGWGCGCWWRRPPLDPRGPLG